jgi:ATP-binding cassette subfamily B protein
VGVSATDLVAVGRCAILHWNASHFVVLDRIGRRGIRILDPATGRRVLPHDEFQRSFSGVAIIFEPTPTFEQCARETAARGARSPFKGRLGKLSRVATFALLERLSIFVVPVLAQMTIDDIVDQTSRLSWMRVGWAVAVALPLQACSTALHDRFRLSLRSELDSEMFSSSVWRLLRSPLEFFDRRSIDDMAAGVEMNALIREIVSRHAISAVVGGSVTVLVLLWILHMNRLVGVIFIVVAVVRVLTLELSQRVRLPRQQHASQTRHRSQAYLRRSLSAIAMVKSMGLEDRAFTSWRDLFTAQQRAFMNQGVRLAWISALSTAVQLASTVAIVMAGAAEASSGHVTLGGMAAVLLISESFLVAVHDTWSGVRHILTWPAYSERIHDVPDAQFTGADRTATSGPGHGAIRLDRVSFRYGPVSDWALEDVSTAIAPGEFVAVVGPSGAGKSTLAKVLAGLLVPSEGTIRCDAQDPAVSGGSWGAAALVRESEPLFAGTIRSNILLGGLLDAGEDRVIHAAQHAQVHVDIMRMPRQYETLLLDGGAALSGGERQRITLARVLTREQPLLILDNATSQVDPITETAILRSLVSMGSTLVVVTNRVGTATRADRILVMDRGRIVEQGIHADLVERGGLYGGLLRAELGRASSTAP